MVKGIGIQYGDKFTISGYGCSSEILKDGILLKLSQMSGKSIDVTLKGQDLLYYKDIVKYSEKFEEVEPRHFFYNVAADLLSRSTSLNDSVNALLVILLTWNKDFYRTHRFDKAHVDQFTEALRKTRLLFKFLKNESLEHLEVDKQLKVKEHSFTVGRIIETIYDEISSVVGYTGASKAMHLIHKELFVMWDVKIRKNYKCSDLEYLDFLLIMQEEAREAIKTYSAEFKCGQVKAKDQVSNLRGGKVLTKLIDEYNYVRYTKGIVL